MQNILFFLLHMQNISMNGLMYIVFMFSDGLSDPLVFLKHDIFDTLNFYKSTHVRPIHMIFSEFEDEIATLYQKHNICYKN